MDNREEILPGKSDALRLTGIHVLSHSSIPALATVPLLKIRLKVVAEAFDLLDTKRVSIIHPAVSVKPR
jgi:hypothetical protein